LGVASFNKGSVSIVILCTGATYYALWKARQQRLHAVNTKFVNGTQNRMVPDSTRAPTAAILTHVTTETEDETDFRPQERREPEPEINVTDEEEAWASATASLTGYFPVTSFAEQENPLASFLDEHSWATVQADGAVESPVMTSFVAINNSPNFEIDVSPLTENDERTACETPDTSVVENGDSVTSFEVLENPFEPTDNFRQIPHDADLKYHHMTSLVDTKSTATNDGGCFPGTETAAGSSGCSAGESPMTSSVDDAANPVTSCPNGLTESRLYPQTGCDVTKLVLQRYNRSLVLQRVQLPTASRLSAEVAEHVTIESLPTADQSLARLYDSMRNLCSSPRDEVNKDTITQSSFNNELCENAEYSGQAGGVLDLTNRQRTTPEPETNATASEDRDNPKEGWLLKSVQIK